MPFVDIYLADLGLIVVCTPFCQLSWTWRIDMTTGFDASVIPGRRLFVYPVHVSPSCINIRSHGKPLWQVIRYGDSKENSLVGERMSAGKSPLFFTSHNTRPL